MKENGKSILKYEFFDECFLVNNTECIVEIDYDCIEKVIDLRDCYYLVIKGSIIMLSKDGFIFGNKEEIKEFIKQRMAKQEVML